jgi:CHAT domain-containing protein
MIHSARPPSSLSRMIPIVFALLATVFTATRNVRSAPAGYEAQAKEPQQPSAQNHLESILLEPGKLLEREIAGGRNMSFRIEMMPGQYSVITVDCGKTTARITLYDDAGSAVSEYRTSADSPKLSVEIAAKAVGQYRLDIKSKLPDAPAGNCTALLAAPRSASESELQLEDARELAYQASTLADAGKFDEATAPAKRALELLERLLGPDDPSLATPLFVLGNIFRFKASFSSAEALYLRALRIQEKTAGPVSDKVFSIVNNLGILYIETDEFDKAEPALRRAIDIAEKLHGPGNAMEANSLVNLANLYEERADYTQAQNLFERAMEIAEREFGPNYPGLATIIANLSGVYSEKGDFVKAETFGQRAISILEKAVGPEDGRFGIPLVTLGDAYRFEGQLEKAEPLYERALAIFEKTRGPEHPLVADTLTYLAEIHHDRRDFAKAESLYQQALAIREKKLGNDHQDVGLTLDRLATLYRDQGEYARAEPLYQRALAIREKALGPEHPDVVSTLTNIATLQMATGRFGEAEASLSRAINISERNADFNLLAGSERQKLAYLDLLSAQLHKAITLNVSFDPGQTAARDLALSTVLQRKGRVQDVLSDNLAVLQRRLTPENAEFLAKFNRVTSQMARLVLGGPQNVTIEEHQRRIDALKDEREHLEAEISLRSAEFRASSRTVAIEAVRRAIPENAALLEFFSYRRFLPRGITENENFGERRYVVYVLTPGSDVQWKELNDAKTLDDAVHKFRDGLRDPKRSEVSQLARAVDEQVLQPVRGMIGDATHLLVSPDGELDLIPFEALVDKHGHFAIERYSITYLTAGRDLLRMQVPREYRSVPLLVADPFFGEALTVQAARTKGSRTRATKARRSITTAEDLSSVYFAPLGGTAQEARTIKSLFPEAQVLTGQQATKAALKQVEAPRLLHIATHGFFLLDAANDTTEASAKSVANGTRAISASAKIENPLLRSGLALAGANLNRDGGEDGILTALEASNLNLWGTKLVTLSACDTGVGEVRNGEGVYGLRRAFFLAGTESMVMSLWPVSDYVTRGLMTDYYTGLKRGLGRGEALRQAQLAMLKRKGRQHPFYWASFIQSGEWANLDGQR